MRTKDILIVGLLFALIIETGVNIANGYRIFKLEKEVLDTKKEAIEIYYENKDYIYMLEDSRKSLNDALDDKDKELQEYKYLEKFKKDIDRSN